MPHVEIREEVSLRSPTMIEGLLGVGLVGKIATDHVIEALEMAYIGDVRCPGLPQVTVYEKGDQSTYPPVRLYASEPDDLVVLRSEVTISPSEVTDFATCITNWIDSEDGTAMYVSGRPTDVESGDDREVNGVATEGAKDLLADTDVEPPTASGVWSGPTGALLARADEVGVDAIGLVVDSDPEFPDPEAACAYITRGINPVAGLTIDDSDLRDHAEAIRREKEDLARQMSQPGDDASRADPTGMFQ